MLVTLFRISNISVFLYLKVLGDGDVTGVGAVKAAAFSESAKAKIEAAGGSVEVIPGRQKWMRAAKAMNAA